MAKAIKHGGRVWPSPHLPVGQQRRKFVELVEQAERAAAHARRFLWLAVKKAGGRLEIDEADYREAMKMPAENSCVGMEHDKSAGKVVFIHTDEKGEPLPQSDPKRIILTDSEP
jgi:hypothetical protein